MEGSASAGIVSGRRGSVLYRTPQWKAVRDAVRRRCGGRCERCGAAHSRIEVHHIYPIASREGMTFTKADLDPAGLEALCPPCHWEETAKMNRRTPSPEEQAWMEFCGDLME